MPEDEGALLHRLALERLPHGPVLEIGSYCGKSAVWLGAAAREVGGTVFTVDHHRGSEENQAGWEHHDPDLVDPATGRMDTLPHLRRTLAARRARGARGGGRRATRRPSRATGAPRCRCCSSTAATAHEPAHADYDGWARWVQPGGLLVVHDVFPDPADGGRPPYEIYLRALDDGFEEVDVVGSMRALRRVSGEPGALEGVG